MIEIHRYTAAYHRDWNDFVSESSNGTFLFCGSIWSIMPIALRIILSWFMTVINCWPCYRQTVRAMCCTRMPD